MTIVVDPSDSARDAGTEWGLERARLKRERVIEECEFFLDYTTYGAVAVAERLRMKVTSLHRALTIETRANRPDLWDRLKDRDVLAGRTQVRDVEWYAAQRRARERVGRR